MGGFIIALVLFLPNAICHYSAETPVYKISVIILLFRLSIRVEFVERKFAKSLKES